VVKNNNKFDITIKEALCRKILKLLFSFLLYINEAVGSPYMKTRLASIVKRFVLSELKKNKMANAA